MDRPQPPRQRSGAAMVGRADRHGMLRQLFLQQGVMASQDLEHDTYARALDTLEALDRRLAMAAAVVDTLHPGAAALAGRVLAYAEHRFPDRDVLSVYADRARPLARLQDRFHAAPAAAPHGAPDASRDSDGYTIELLP